VVVSENSNVQERLSDLEKRLTDHHAAYFEASRVRHAYLVNNVFGMAQLVMLVFGLLGSAALAAFIYYVGIDHVGARLGVIIAVVTFFALFWLTQRGSRRLLGQKKVSDEEALPAFPEWQGRNDG
jgi:hypothetical protein